MRVIVTGGAGFIGSAVCRDLVGHGGFEVLNIDKLTYAGNLASLKSVEGAANYRFMKADIRDAEAMWEAFEGFRPDCVMHLAAESHVDRSITGAREFIDTNVTGTFVLLEAARPLLDGARLGSGRGVPLPARLDGGGLWIPRGDGALRGDDAL